MICWNIVIADTIFTAFNINFSSSSYVLLFNINKPQSFFFLAEYQLY